MTVNPTYNTTYRSLEDIDLDMRKAARAGNIAALTALVRERAEFMMPAIPRDDR